MPDINEIIGRITGGNNNASSLNPTTTATTNYVDMLPARPTYTPYVREEFDWTVPDSEKPAGSENWTWSRNIKAKQLFDQEQDKKEDSAYNQYQTDLAGWTDAVNLVKADQERKQQDLTNYNTQLTAAGLNPLSSLSDLPKLQIQQLGQQWQATTDPTLRNQYHQQALTIAQNAGYIPKDYVGSVNGYVPTTLAGTPTAETQYKTDYLNYQKDRDNQEYLLNVAKLSKSGSSGGGSGSGNYSISQQVDDAWKIFQTTGKVPAILKQLYPDLKDKTVGASDETKAMQQYLTKFKDGANARAYLQKFGSQGDVDIAYLSEWGKKYFGDDWLLDPTVTFDRYGKATAIKK